MLAACAPDAVLAPVEETSAPREPCEAVYSTVPVGECDLYLQDCEGDRRCVVASETTICSDPFGGRQEGEPCESATQCEASLSCVFGYCSPVCCPLNDLPCGHGYCAGSETYGSFAATRCVYSERCQVFDPTSCADAEPPGDCHVIQGKGVSLCLPPSADQDEGEPCDAYNDCGAAQVCHGARCRFSCRLGTSGLPPGEGGCPTGQQCNVFEGGYADIGVCG